MDTFALITAERLRLADELGDLSDNEWAQPSLCEGWSVAVVAAHLNGGWGIGPFTFAQTLFRRRGDIAATMNQVTLDLADRMPPDAAIEGLRSNAAHRFTPPGIGPSAPLTDVIVHGADMLRPLGRSVDVAPDALATVLEFLAKGRARGFMPSSRVDGLAFEATDLGIGCGTGDAVAAGPALSLCGAILGRRTYLDDLEGMGAELLAMRI